MVSPKEFRDPFRAEQGVYELLKTIDGRDTRPNFVIFVFLSALIAGRWVVLALSRKLG